MIRRTTATLFLTFALGLGGRAEAAPTPISACGTVSTPGAYVLDQSLTHSGNGSCLLIAADFVTLDLAGFTISGDGTGIGIGTDGNKRVGIAVRGGTVEHFGVGIHLAVKTAGTVIEAMRVFNNTEIGIFVGSDSLVHGNVASGNGHTGSLQLDRGGIHVGNNSLVTGNVASENPAIGISIGRNGTLTRNTASHNTLGGFLTAGLRASSNGTVSNNTASDNLLGPDGMSIECPSNIVANTAVNNAGTNLDMVSSGCNDVDNLAP